MNNRVVSRANFDCLHIRTYGVEFHFRLGIASRSTPYSCALKFLLSSSCHVCSSKPAAGLDNSSRYCLFTTRAKHAIFIIHDRIVHDPTCSKFTL